MTSLSRVLNKGVSRSPIRTQCYGILDMSQNNGCSRRENTHTKPNKQTKTNTTRNIKESSMIASVEAWPGLKIRTPIITFSRK